ncbi:MAG: Holliday junction resolvase RuvX [Candidatus Sumerlaeia bacterium]|nr:Holliday junction resolvase RuvX [Candidatus Sumerlaeia bacterium]
MNETKPVPRILALDLGKARIGVAVSDPLGWTAQPVGVIQTRRRAEAVRQIRQLVEHYEAATLVVGLPYNADGSEGPQARWVREFGEHLRHTLGGIAVVYWDERWTSEESDALMAETGVARRKRKARRDRIAAALILKSYLDSGKPRLCRRPADADPQGGPSSQ